MYAIRSYYDKDMCEMVIIEHMSSLKLPEEIGGFRLEKSKKFGKSTLSYYKPVFE